MLNPAFVPGAAPLQDADVEPLPQDVEALSNVGFDLDRPFVLLGAGKHGCVFKGKCNRNATYRPTLQGTSERSTVEVSLYLRECAIKMGTPEVYAGGEFSGGDEVLRLLELQHPNIVQMYYTFNSIFDNTKDKARSHRYFVMEIINGDTLLNRVKPIRAYIPEAEALNAILDLTAGLHYLHSAGVQHMDFHAGNVMYHDTPNGRRLYKIVDFGASLRGRGSMISQYDIYYLGSHFILILDTSVFQREKLKKELRLFCDRVMNMEWKQMEALRAAILPQIPLDDDGGAEGGSPPKRTDFRHVRQVGTQTTRFDKFKGLLKWNKK